MCSDRRNACGGFRSNSDPTKLTQALIFGVCYGLEVLIERRKDGRGRGRWKTSVAHVR
jgi:hypothetical protein